ncbi:MAG: gyrase subunit A protein [candidate division TM6 bacterium GW2011_GWF2_32_72]|nr:MAG: gyrase subunit A protein [candidate division TM6 bacterium GW2011_GWF2_32_72]
MDNSKLKDDTRGINTKPVLIEEELKKSFLDYAMSVIVSRAIPDVRDGLKPVHRRVLYAMGELGFYYNKPYHKSARVVGDVLAKYHPHGDTAVYDTMVGMVQDFSKRYPLLDGQGNWGSVDGDNAAAMRYTEVRMAKIAQELLADIDKKTVPFVPNFDESIIEPTLLPSRVPNLLINGTAGIAVGMATSIPPHNLTEVINACLALLKNVNISDDELFSLVPAPDFPTGGVICGRAGIVQAYKTGRGRLILRGVVDVEETKTATRLIITELPYQVNKAELAIKIADLVKNKIVEGISNIKDESSRKGMRLIIDLKRGEIPQVVLNQLYKFTPLQTSVSFLMLALLDNQPVIFTLRRMLNEFLYHRKNVVYRRSVFDLKKAQQREHILEGFKKALANIDEVIILIKKSMSAEEAIEALSKKFDFTSEQGKAILEMRLQRLTGMEQEKIDNEMNELKKLILYLKSIIENEDVLKKEIEKELLEIKETYGDKRKTKVEGAVDILTEADLIPDEEAVVTITGKGYIKRVPLDVYDVQHRGGRGKMGMASLTDSDDVMQDLFVAKTHDELLFFTNLGRVYSMQVFEVPEGSRTSKGRAVVNILPLAQDERIVKLLCTRDIDDQYLVMVTKQGTIKRTEGKSFAKIRATGIRAISLNEGDELSFCATSTGKGSIVLATKHGQGIHFKEEEVRAMGRQASGVIGIRLKAGDYVVGMEAVSPDSEMDLLFATSMGYGKRTKVVDFRVAHRGGVGVRTIPTGSRNGYVVGLALVAPESNILLIDSAGKIIRLSPTEIRTMGRQAKGVRLIRLDSDRHLVNVVAFEEDGIEESDNNSGQENQDQAPKKTAKIKADDSDSDDSENQTLQFMETDVSDLDFASIEYEDDFEASDETPDDILMM